LKLYTDWLLFVVIYFFFNKIALALAFLALQHICRGLKINLIIKPNLEEMKNLLKLLCTTLFVLLVLQINVQAQDAKVSKGKKAKSAVENGATTVENGQDAVEKGKATAKKGKGVLSTVKFMATNPKAFLKDPKAGIEVTKATANEAKSTVVDAKNTANDAKSTVNDAKNTSKGGKVTANDTKKTETNTKVVKETKAAKNVKKEAALDESHW
jgi:hypothetical protein